MKTIACGLLALGLVGLASPARAQEVIVAAPTVTYYAPSVPVTTYYAPPVTTYYAPAPVTAYYAPAPVTAYYGAAVVPTYSYYASPVFVPRRAYRRAVRWGW